MERRNQILRHNRLLTVILEAISGEKRGVRLYFANYYVIRNLQRNKDSGRKYGDAEWGIKPFPRLITH